MTKKELWLRFYEAAINGICSGPLFEKYGYAEIAADAAKVADHAMNLLPLQIAQELE